MISEVMAINYGRKYFDRVLIFRPHNVYGPNMGWEHVIPDFLVRMIRLGRIHPDVIPFPIQGTGQETRSFVFIRDFIDGLMHVINKGEHLGIYHIGTREEVSIQEVALEVARCLERQIQIIPGKITQGSTPRRCPDITKIMKLGYHPRYTLKEGLPLAAQWYVNHFDLAPDSAKAGIT